MIPLKNASNLDAAVKDWNSRFMRKLTFGILGVVGLFVLGLIVLVGFAVIRGIKPPADLATRPWIEHKFYTDQLVLDVPWKLDAKTPSHDVASNSRRMDACRRDGVEVVINVSHAAAGGDLDTGMNRMTQLLKEEPGTTILTEARKEESILGGRGIVLYMSVRDSLWRKTDVRIMFFKLHDRLYQVHCNSPMGDPIGDKVWDRMKKSIRPAKAPDASAETIKSNQPSGLPEGMRRR